ncbi:MAG: surface-adhesin E family protein [Smithella sp.]
MKFKILWISLIVVVFSFPSLCFSEQPDSKVGEPFDNNWYYNKTNITKSANIISVWTYNIVTDDFRKHKIEEIKKVDLDKSVKYQNYDHNLGLWKIDSINKQKRLIELTDYDDKGNILDRNIYKDSEWKNIKPNSVFEKLYIKVGVTQNEPLALAKEPLVKEQLKEASLEKEPLKKEPLVKEQLKKEPLITPGIPDSKVWKYFSDNIYYNKTNITKSSDIIFVSTYNIIRDDFRKHKIEEIKKNDLEKSIKYQHYDHKVVWSEINCKKRLTRTKKYIDYDDNGKVLYSYTYKSREWKKNVPESIGENLHEKFCMSTVSRKNEEIQEKIRKMEEWIKNCR